MHEADRVLLNLVCKTEQDCPVYLTHTSLNEDATGIGRVPFRQVTVPNSEEHSICLITDSSLDLDVLKTVSLAINISRLPNKLSRKELMVS